MIWPFKLRDLPETKNLLIPKIPDRLPGNAEEPRSKRYYPGKVFDDYERDKWNLGRMRDEHFDLLYGKNYEEYRRKFVVPYTNRNYGNIQSAGLQNSTPNYHPSELQNAATDVDLFAIEMARNANEPAAPDSPEADLTNSTDPSYPTSDRG